MNKDFNTQLNEFKAYLKDVEYLNAAIAALYWDSRTYIPRKGVEYRGEVLGYLSGELYKKQTSDTMKGFIDAFSALPDADDVTKAMADRAKREYDRSMKIPEDRYRAYVVAVSAAEAAWEDAKEKSDYALFKPHLEKLIGFNREFVEYWGYESSKYDKLLDYYEPGITTAKLDAVFGEVRDAIVALLDKIKAKPKPDDQFMKSAFPEEAQARFSHHVLEKMGYDFGAGRLDVSVHPFTITMGMNDVRITTHYYENELRSALYSSIHEGGHAIYEQNIDHALAGTMLMTGASMGIHESQSRFYENLIGRSRAFWECFYPEAQKEFPQLTSVPMEAFYKAVNAVQPSLIRIESDELTYSLHIIIRYELEKAIFDGGANVDELPALWSAKYKEYLGVEPKNDGEGILQDTHWSGGNFGYFPSYALGNLYGAQFLHTMKKDVPYLEQCIAAGDLMCINSWLKEHVHKYGAVYLPEELIQKVTGQPLTAKYFIEYLNGKYADIYGI
jgi:carboxypeptidase Taq